MILACVRTGTKYGIEYVDRLRRGVAQHLPSDYRFVCLTDKPDELPGYQTIHIAEKLPGWWGKMKLFDPSWRKGEKVVFLDLDSVIIGDLSPLAGLEADFAICANFTVIHQRRVSVAGGERKVWPCKYGSMCFMLGPQHDDRIWQAFMADPEMWMKRYDLLGDQRAIEEIEPHAELLQDLLPDGFFLGYRDLPNCPVKPPRAAIVVFAGPNKPHNTQCQWARREWIGSPQ